MPRAGWRETWLGWRNGALASPRFQRWAAGFWLTRPVARRRARGLFDLVGGFVYSQVLLACVRLDLFQALAQGPATLPSLAPRLGLSPEAASRLLKAAAALSLAERLPDGRFMLGPHGAALRGNPALLAMIEHHALLYADLADPVALLRGELPAPRLAAFWGYARNPDPAALPPPEAAAYSALMAESQALIAAEVLDAYPLRRHRCLLDLGGGAGAFLAEAGRRAPGLRLLLLDLPAVVPLARARLDAAGLAGRAIVRGGDFFAAPLPSGADIISLVRVLHDHDDSAASLLLRRARAALPPGGTLLVAEPLSGTPGAAPVGDAYFGLYLAAMGSGRTRTLAELTAMLHSAGFRAVRRHPTRTPLVVSVLTAEAA